jgi:hypothetical protein
MPRQPFSIAFGPARLHCSLGRIAMRRLGKFHFWFVLVASCVLGVCAAFPIYMRIPEQCVLCRAERNEYHVFGISFSGGCSANGEFTRWYAAHRPPHAHIWHSSSAGCLPCRNFFGLPIALYLMKGHPVLHLRASDGLRFVKQTNDATLQQFFFDAGSPNAGAALRAADLARKALAEVK